MAEAVGTASSIVGIVSFGLKLATTLQTYVELVREAKEELQYIVFDVNATSAALRQLQAIVDSDEDSDASARVFKEDGVREIEILAAKCDRVYKNIILLIQSASNSEAGKGDKTTKDGDVTIDISSLKTLTFMGRLKWPWLRPRITRCHEQLKWLKISLLFTLQMANLAQSQMSGKLQAGAIEQEVYIRRAAEKLRKQQNRIIRDMAKRAQNKSERELQAMLEEELQNDGSSSSDNGTWEDMDEPPPKQEEKIISDPKPEDAIHLNHNEKGVDMSVASSPSLSLATASGRMDDSETNKTTLNSTPATTAVASPSISGKPNQFQHFNLFAVSQSPVIAAPAINARDEQPTKNNEVVEQDRSFGRQQSSASKSTLLPYDSLSSQTIPSKSIPAAPETLFSQQLPVYLSHWAERIFGSQSKYRKDKSSQSLEAYIKEDGESNKPIKIPFGHESLQYGLKKVLKDWRGSTWSKYIALSPEKRAAIDRVTNVARKASSHEKTCIAFKEYIVKDQNHSFLLVFFALDKIQDPVIFKDGNGRKFLFPYEACRKLEGMEELIKEACKGSPSYAFWAHKLENRRYDLADGENKIILPSFWEASIAPGLEISMTIHTDPLTNNLFGGSGITVVPQGPTPSLFNAPLGEAHRNQPFAFGRPGVSAGPPVPIQSRPLSTSLFGNPLPRPVTQPPRLEPESQPRPYVSHADHEDARHRLSTERSESAWRDAVWKKRELAAKTTAVARHRVWYGSEEENDTPKTSSRQSSQYDSRAAISSLRAADAAMKLREEEARLEAREKHRVRNRWMAEKSPNDWGRQRESIREQDLTRRLMEQDLIQEHRERNALRRNMESRASDTTSIAKGDSGSSLRSSNSTQKMNASDVDSITSDEELDLDVLDLGFEEKKGKMGISKWLGQMTNAVDADGSTDADASQEYDSEDSVRSLD